MIKFIRSTALQISTFRPFDFAFVSAWCSVFKSCKLLSLFSFRVFVIQLSFFLSARAIEFLKFLEGKGFKIIFSVAEVEALLQTLVCGWACSGLQMCLHLSIGNVFYF
jgi:hypothetical protein